MSTLKHQSFCSGPMNYKSVTDLPGIGPTYGGRLNMAGYHTAQDIYNKFKSMNFDSSRCQMWLNSVCNANSRYSGMCYDALKQWHDQFGERSNSPRQHKQQLYRNDTLLLQSPERILNMGVHRSIASHNEPDFNRTEVMQMLAEFRQKQDAMAVRISDLEQEKSRTDNYIKTLETKIETMNKKAAELQKQQDAKVIELTNKLRAMDRTEMYSNISSSIYLLNEKFDDLLTELNKVKKTSLVLSYIKALESKINQIETNMTELQKQQDDKCANLMNKVNANNTQIDGQKELSSSINTLVQKFDELIKRQNEQKQDKISIHESSNPKIKQMEQDLHNSTKDMYKITKTSSETKIELPESDKSTKLTDTQKHTLTFLE